jgi:hypothetical protein
MANESAPGLRHRFTSVKAWELSPEPATFASSNKWSNKDMDVVPGEDNAHIHPEKTETSAYTSVTLLTPDSQRRKGLGERVSGCIIGSLMLSMLPVMSLHPVSARYAGKQNSNYPRYVGGGTFMVNRASIFPGVLFLTSIFQASSTSSYCCRTYHHFLGDHRSVQNCCVTELLNSQSFAANGTIGATLHIPFPVLNRSSFGFYFAYFSVISRVVLAMFWFGIQTYTGSECVYQVILPVIALSLYVLIFSL